MIELLGVQDYFLTTKAEFILFVTVITFAFFIVVLLEEYLRFIRNSIQKEAFKASLDHNDYTKMVWLEKKFIEFKQGKKRK